MHDSIKNTEKIMHSGVFPDDRRPDGPAQRLAAKKNKIKTKTFMFIRGLKSKKVSLQFLFTFAKKSPLEGLRDFQTRVIYSAVVRCNSAAS